MLPRRVQLALGALSMVLLLGVLGLAWWGWRHRTGRRASVPFRRAGVALAAVGLIVIALGAAWRLDTALQPTASCAPPSGPPAAPSSGLSASLAEQQAATWPETGIGLLYAQTNGALVCLSQHADYYVAVNAHHIAGTHAMTVGDIVLTPGFNMTREERAALAAHEAHHRVQWAWATVIGGPLAFPVAYGIVDFFYPGARNPFERAAGLEGGQYEAVGAGPVLGAAQLAVLAVLAAIIALAIAAAWHRRSERAQARS
jgi:hypothetical protein